MRLLLTMERFDKNGLLLEKSQQWSRSLVKHFIDLLYVQFGQIQYTAPYAITDVNGVARNIDSQTAGDSHNPKGNFAMASSMGTNYLQAGATSWADQIGVSGNKLGIMVGTGVGAVSPTDNSLGTLILHGNGPGQLEYAGCEVVNLVVAGANASFDVRRYFTNRSGGAINVTECGIAAGGTRYGIAVGNVYSYSFLIARDLTGGVNVLDTELLRVTYTLQITV